MTTTYTGRLVTPTNMGVPHPRDMAVQLGRIPRYAGATVGWWSVLHHLYTCSQLVQQVATRDVLLVEGRADLGLVSTEVKELAVLLHEIDEVCTGDVPTPWKPIEFRRQSDPLQARAYTCYMGFNPGPSLRAYIRHVDELALYGEMETVAPNGCMQHSGYLSRPFTADDEVGIRAAIEVTLGVQGRFSGPMASADAMRSPLPQWFMARMEQLMAPHLWESACGLGRPRGTAPVPRP